MWFLIMWLDPCAFFFYFAYIKLGNKGIKYLIQHRCTYFIVASPSTYNSPTLFSFLEQFCPTLKCAPKPCNNVEIASSSHNFDINFSICQCFQYFFFYIYNIMKKWRDLTKWIKFNIDQSSILQTLHHCFIIMSISKNIAPSSPKKKPPKTKQCHLVWIFLVFLVFSCLHLNLHWSALRP